MPGWVGGVCQNSRLHIPSVVAMIASLILILIALNQINEWSALSFWVCLGGGFVLLAAALFQQTDSPRRG